MNPEYSEPYCRFCGEILIPGEECQDCADDQRLEDKELLEEYSHETERNKDN